MFLWAIALSLLTGVGCADASDPPSYPEGWQDDVVVALGTQDYASQAPEAVRALSGGDALGVVFGPQGAWMVVMSLALEGYLPDEIVYAAGLRQDGEPLAEVRYRNPRPLTPLEDGGERYVRDIFLVTQPIERFVGEEMEVYAEVWTADESGSWEVALPIRIEAAEP